MHSKLYQLFVVTIDTGFASPFRADEGIAKICHLKRVEADRSETNVENPVLAERCLMFEVGILLWDMSVSFPHRVPEELPRPPQTTSVSQDPGWTCRSLRVCCIAASLVPTHRELSLGHLLALTHC